VGSVIAGPVGAVVGGVAGAMMGNRSAEGKPVVPPSVTRPVSAAAKTVQKKVAAKVRSAKRRPSSRGKSSSKKKGTSSKKKGTKGTARAGGRKRRVARRAGRAKRGGRRHARRPGPLRRADVSRPLEREAQRKRRVVAKEVSGFGPRQLLSRFFSYTDERLLSGSWRKRPLIRCGWSGGGQTGGDGGPRLQVVGSFHPVSPSWNRVPRDGERVRRDGSNQ
jgi:hypothetical protein